jgi:NDP-sugar pyrophosphorylase family protein
LKGLILAGGFATRLRPLSCSKPKLLFPLVGVPLVDRMAHWFARGGVAELILAVNHLSDKLRIEVARRNLETETVLSVEETPLGTGGPISLAKPLLGGDETLIVANGDVIHDIDLHGLVIAHSQSGAMATIALVSVEDPRQFGLATLDSRDRIVGFEEKSQTRHGQGWINAGVYALSPDAVAMIPDGRPVSLEREIFPILARQGKMNGWKHAGFWYDIGKIPDYITANRELLQRAEFRETGSSTGMNMSSLQIREPSYVGKECVLEESSKLGPYTILSEKVTVKKGSEVRGTIVFEQTSIGEDCIVEDSLIGEGVSVGKGARIGKGSIIAGQVAIRDGATIKPGSTVLN